MLGSRRYSGDERLAHRWLPGAQDGDFTRTMADFLITADDPKTPVRCLARLNALPARYLSFNKPETEQDLINWLTGKTPGGYVGITNASSVKELLKFYSPEPAAGSPYGTGNQTFGLAAQYKRLASVVGDLVFEASRRDFTSTATKFGVKAWQEQYIWRECLINSRKFLTPLEKSSMEYIMAETYLLYSRQFTPLPESPKL
ncbi:hypothetical protein RhiLY_02409 [Ceratobasidium sp. AG-Ba]|nr:hypothetical protein RhiLY_02409 [Ceratobasidium sp. AG-Ba]